MVFISFLSQNGVPGREEFKASFLTVYGLEEFAAFFLTVHGLEEVTGVIFMPGFVDSVYFDGRPPT